MMEDLETNLTQTAEHDEQEIGAQEIGQVLPDLADGPDRQKQGPVADQRMLGEVGAVFDVPIRVQAVLGRAHTDIGSLMQLKPGDVLDLDRRVGSPVDILVNDRLIARGEVVLIDGVLGVTLTEVVREGS